MSTARAFILVKQTHVMTLLIASLATRALMESASTTHAKRTANVPGSIWCAFKVAVRNEARSLAPATLTTETRIVRTILLALEMSA